MNEWISSKKTKDMIFGVGYVFLWSLFLGILAKGDPVVIGLLIQAFLPLILAGAGIVGVKIGAQGYADRDRPKSHEAASLAHVYEARADAAKAERHLFESRKEIPKP